MAFLVALNGVGVTQNVPQRQMTNARRRNQELHVINTLQCWRTVSECRKISVEKQRHGTKSEMYRRGLQELDDSGLVLDACQDIAIIVGFLAACSYLLQDVRKAASNSLQMLTLLMYWSRATEAVRSAGSLYARIINETRNTAILQSILQKSPTVNPRLECPEFHFGGGAVEFDDLSFSYDGHREVIKSLSFTVKAGQKVAIVGQTGSGKSTIFRLLSRHFDPSHGRILVDGQDLCHVSLDSYREVLGIVSQNTILMNASIRENVAYPCFDASDEHIISACKAAEIHETIMQLPKQYDQEVGGLAGKLSGGENQRLVLARLYVQDPKIVLLDEATSNLDGTTEQKTWALLNTFCRGRTTFIITHRLSTIQNVDKIIVIEQGAKTEEGTHAELIANGESSYLASLKAQNSSQVWS
ncbi:hypothetical protein B0A55_10496 [Friedmanniomyces simplex]|uniref:ABC transporter domain-containing protein n=1 Tax=Friedmanniomyces simplex TaxID=329884 RepID=A0A4U0WR48_9PEZI|nr:hypothetical protein B0A55_10496 [Friedmanniomyces simplex]